MTTWKLQDAKARFSELLETALRKGPQMVTRRGVETAVIIPVAQWRRLQQEARPSLKDWLLSPGARTDDLVPPRTRFKRRKPVIF